MPVWQTDGQTSCTIEFFVNMSVARQKARKILVISPHGIAMPKGYILPLWFLLSSFLFSMLNLWGHWTDLNQTCIHIFTHNCYLKEIARTPPCIYPSPPRAGEKNVFGTDFETDRTYLCNETWYQQSERILPIYRDSTTCLQIGELWSRNGWERMTSFFPPS